MSTLAAVRALELAGDYAAAEMQCREMLHAAPRDPGALLALGRLRRLRGDASGAADVLAQAERSGAGAAVAVEFAALSLDEGRADRAAELLRRAAGGSPLAVEVQAARLLAAQGQPAAAAAKLRAVVSAHPNQSDARLEHARVLMQMDRPADAEAALKALLRRAPNHEPALALLAFLCGSLRRFHDALALYDQLEARGGDYTPWVSQAVLGLMHVCDWSRRDALTARLVARVASDRPCLLEAYTLLAATDEPAVHRQMAERIAGVVLAQSGRGAAPARRPIGPPTRRLRLGYLCGALNQHATALLLAGVIEAHDRAAFEVWAYDYSREDGSPMRARMRQAFEHFVPLGTEGPADTAARIAADGIDILVDLNGYTENARSAIVALRPAPIQVNFLGYVATQGDDWTDYFIADRIVLPREALADWVEAPVWMPHTCYPSDRTRPLPPPETDRAAHGLPAEAVVLACFNNPFKIAPAVFAVWMEILLARPACVLWLFEGNEFVAANLRRHAAAAGVAPTRLVFARPAPLEQHLARHGCADLFLDTLPYGAHTTGVDALWAGLPVVTCLGRSVASRVGGSLLHAVGLDELATGSLEEYRALVLALVDDAARRADLRHRLAQARGSAPLFDAVAFCRALEDAYRQMADRHRAGLPPVPIEVAGDVRVPSAHATSARQP